MLSFILSSFSFTFAPDTSFGPKILKTFSENLNIPLEVPGDTAKVLEIMERILAEKSFTLPKPPLAGTLSERVTTLQMLLDPSKLQQRVDVVTAMALRGEMKGLLEKKVVELRSLALKELIQKALPEIPPFRISNFVSTVEGFYGKALSEGKAPKEALIYALGKGLVREIVKPPSSEEIEANEELQKKIKADPELEPYMCAITKDYLISDGVYLRKDADDNPRERYCNQAIREWISKHGTDPIDRSKRTLADIKPDLKGKEMVERKLLAMFYPEVPVETSTPLEAWGGGLRSKALLLALGVAYPLIKEEYQRVRSHPQDPSALVEAIEIFARKTLDRCVSLIDEMDFEVEVVVPDCFSAIKDFLRQAEKKLSSENLEEVREEFIKKLSTFVSFSHEIQMPAASKEKALKLGSLAIEKGDSLEEVKWTVVNFDYTKKENAIRKRFPGCLFGVKEWFDYLGAVKEEPLPEDLLFILARPCPITPGKRVGETHRVVLIPKTVKGWPLTLDQLELLVRGEWPYTLDGFAGARRSSISIEPVENSYYVLITKDPLPQSKGKPYWAQQEMVRKLAEKFEMGYEVTSLLPVAVSTLMHYITSERTRAFNKESWPVTRCQEEGGAVTVGFTQKGLEFGCEHEFSDNIYGVVVMWKF